MAGKDRNDGNDLANHISAKNSGMRRTKYPKTQNAQNATGNEYSPRHSLINGLYRSQRMGKTST
jgi:hypothetical protein